MAEVLEGRTISVDQHLTIAPLVSSGRLFIVYPPERVGAIQLTQAGVTLGRDPEPTGTPALIHSTISRKHARIDWEEADRAFVVRDLGSHNGSSLDGERLSELPRRMTHGALLRLADLLMVFEQEAAPADGPGVSEEAIPGQSAAARGIRASVAHAARERTPVLLVGETGSGKEAIAGEIHRLSGRSGPLVTINCAALSPQLVESQLFGHEKGAFTGADRARMGAFRSAAQGTVLLDEIGELPLEHQAKLLRAVQNQEALPAGAGHSVVFDARIVAATNRDLESAVEQGSFRRDLYARLALEEITVPPLRERRADILLWAVRLQSARGPLRLEPDAAAAMIAHAWPDNLRGLERLLLQLDRTGPAGAAKALSSFPQWWYRRAGPDTTPADKRRTPSREELVSVLDQSGWNVSAAASKLGRDRKQIYRWMESLHIERVPR